MSIAQCATMHTLSSTHAHIASEIMHHNMLASHHTASPQHMHGIASCITTSAHGATTVATSFCPIMHKEVRSDTQQRIPVRAQRDTIQTPYPNSAHPRLAAIHITLHQASSVGVIKASALLLFAAGNVVIEQHRPPFGFVHPRVAIRPSFRFRVGLLEFIQTARVWRQSGLDRSPA